jgi:hypothetical protein|eukprot:SAG25_NODE_549_length_7012_cov_5.559959_2_plen_84_part_00
MTRSLNAENTIEVCEWRYRINEGQVRSVDRHRLQHWLCDSVHARTLQASSRMSYEVDGKTSKKGSFLVTSLVPHQDGLGIIKQ